MPMNAISTNPLPQYSSTIGDSGGGHSPSRTLPGLQTLTPGISVGVDPTSLSPPAQTRQSGVFLAGLSSILCVVALLLYWEGVTGRQSSDGTRPGSTFLLFLTLCADALHTHAVSSVHYEGMADRLFSRNPLLYVVVVQDCPRLRIVRPWSGFSIMYWWTRLGDAIAN